MPGIVPSGGYNRATMPANAHTTLPAAELEALARGRHGDVFAVLGPHAEGDGGAAGVRFRTVQPHAARVELVPHPVGAPIEMTRVHTQGVFEAFVPGVTRDGFDYRLRMAAADGSTWTGDDPYRYGPIVGELDRHLLAEGTHHRAFDAFGARLVSHGLARGVHFAVWAPNARRVSVVGDFNGWDGRVHVMRAMTPSGVWEI